MRWVAPILMFNLFTSQSQPLVHQEPHHIPIVENRYVRILDVRAESNDTTAFHIHKNDIAFLSIKGAKIWLQELGQDGKEIDLPIGWTGSDITHSTNPIIHRFANIDKTAFQLVAVEILTNKFRDREFTPLGETLFENSRFSIQQNSRETLRLETPSILVVLTESGEIKALDFIKPRRKINFTVQEDQTKTIIIQAK